MPAHRRLPTTAAQALSWLGVVIAIAAITGCAAPRPLLAQPLAPQTLGTSVTVRQQVTAYFDGHTRKLQVALQVAPNNLSLIGLTAIGQRLFTLSWEGGQARLHSNIESISKLDPMRILADLQLAYWPLASLRAALPDQMRLQQYGTARVLWRDGKLLWFASSNTTDRWGSTLTLFNARVGYRLTIRPLSFQATP